MYFVRIRIYRIVGLSGLLSPQRQQLNPANPQIRQILILTITLFAVIACADPPGATPIHPADPTVAPTATPSPPTPTGRPTATFTSPTMAPTSTTPATASPTATPTIAPTATPESTVAPSPTPLPAGPLVHIGDTVYVVDLAVTPAERTQGLSGRLSMDADRGMLFVYEEDGARTFWMPDMHFPLDMVWIRADCTVAGVTADVPNPPLDTPRDQLELYPSSGMVRFILELNAGQAAMQGIEPGGAVKFDGEIAGQWGC